MKNLICAVTVLAVSTAQADTGGGDTCGSCMSIGEGSFAGSSCDNGFEADITSCTFGDTVTAWFCYTATCDGTATASTCGSGFDTALSAWDACGGSQLACNDDFCVLQSTISWAVNGGTTYYIRLSGFNNACGSYTLDVSCEGGGGGGCGDCDIPSGTPGCSDQACQDFICDQNPFCCAVEWDQLCAALALAQCDCACPWDCGGDDNGDVGIVDFLALLAQWGQVGLSCDFDGGGVGIVDFLALLAAWGPCPEPPTGACCFEDGSCIDITQGDCIGVGEYQGDGSVCDPNPCPRPTGACCLPASPCVILSPAACTIAGGTYGGDGTACPISNCCFVHAGGGCDVGSCAALVVSLEPSCAGSWHSGCAFLAQQFCGICGACSGP